MCVGVGLGCVGGRLGCVWKIGVCVKDCGFVLETEIVLCERVVYWWKIGVRIEKDRGKWWKKTVESCG
jgi:hypothetical protein